MKERGLKLSQLHQIICVDCTKFGQIANDILDQIVRLVLGRLNCKFGPSFFVLSSIASNNLRVARGLESERQRWCTKLTNKSLVMAEVQIVRSKIIFLERVPEEIRLCSPFRYGRGNVPRGRHEALGRQEVGGRFR